LAWVPLIAHDIKLPATHHDPTCGIRAGQKEDSSHEAVIAVIMKKATHTEFERFDDQGKLPSDKKMAPPKRKAFINVDLGEGYGNYKCGPDEELIPMIDHANIACGFQ